MPLRVPIAEWRSDCVFKIEKVQERPDIKAPLEIGMKVSAAAVG